MRKLLLILFLVFPLVSTQAGVVTLNMGLIYGTNSGVPTSPPPWLNATFDDGGSAGSVDLTITAVGMVGVEKVGEVYFNLDPSLDPAQLTFSAPTKTGSFTDPVISKGTDAYKADGDGKFDIMIAFSTADADAFYGGNSVKYTITLGSLTANSFDFLSTPAGGYGPFVTAAHLQALGTNLGSAWVTTPEPATMCLLGLGTLALRRKK